MAFGSGFLGPRATLSRLERRLESPLWESAARVWSTWNRRPRGTGRHIDSAVRPSLTPAPDAAPEQLGAALAEALAEGALDWAIELSARLELLLTGAGSKDGQQARALVLETLLMQGDTARALQFGQLHEAALRRTSRGASLLELLGRGSDAAWLPDGRPNLLGLNRRLSAHALDVEQLANELGVSPLAWLRFPELRLLFYNALWPRFPDRALGFLNSYLSSYGLPACRLRPAREALNSLLDSVAFERPRTHDHGPLVSIAMAARNAATTIGGAIESLLNQSYRSIEILVCDDESEDETLQVAQQRFASDPRVRLFRSTRRQGSYNVRNALFREARGDYFTVHDADDVALPNRIATQLDALRQRNAAACIANLLRVTPEGQIVFFKDQRASRLCMASLMLTRQAFQRVGPYRSAYYGADLELYANLRATLGPESCVRLKIPMVLVLWSGSSVTRSAAAEALENGYRSPARRAYSQLVYRKHSPGSPVVDENEISETLARLDNWVEPTGIVGV